MIIYYRPPGEGYPLTGNRDISNFQGNTFTAVGRDQNHYGPLIVHNINYGQQISQDIRQNDLIHNIPRAKNALYDANDGKGQTRKVCTEGTRTEIITEIVHWAIGNSRIKTLGYWICGMAGTGKSTIAMSVCIELEEKNLLGATFFCTRQIPECRDHSLIIPTIAYQLAHHLPAFAEALVEILRKEPEVFSKPPLIQLKLLLMKPWNTIFNANMQNTVVVIDALDECEDISLVLSALIPAINKQSMPGLKFFFTSRPQGHIQRHLKINRPLPLGSQVEGMFLHDVEEEIVKADIAKFIKEEFEELTIPEKDMYINELAEKSGKLFIYAATMVRYIKNYPEYVEDRLSEILKPTSAPEENQTWDLDYLYSTVIEAAIPRNPRVLSSKEFEECLKILHTMIILVSGSLDHTLRLWDVSTGIQITEPLQGHTDGVVSVAFSPDGTKLASGSRDHTLRLWDVATATQITEPLQGHTNWVYSVAFSPDGTKLASGSRDHTLRLWDVATGTQIIQALQGHTGLVASVAFSPDGTRLASGSVDYTLRLWDVATGTQIREPLQGHTGSVMSVAFSPDGTKLASGSQDDTLRLWDVATRTQIAEPLQGHTNCVDSVASSPDGTKLASGSRDHTLKLWDVATGTQIIQLLQGHTDSVASVAFSPDCTGLASGSLDHTIRLWDVATGTQFVEPLQGHTNSVVLVVFSPDGTKLASNSEDNTLRLWDVATGTQLIAPIQGHTDSLVPVALSSDGTKLASGWNDNTLRLFNVATATQITEPLQGHTNIVTSLAFSPDGTKLVSGSWDKTLRLWNVTTGPQISEPLQGHTEPISSVAFSPDGTKLASGSWDHTLRLWDVATATQIAEPLWGHTNWVDSVAFSPDGTKLASGSFDHTLRLWDVATGWPQAPGIKQSGFGA
ncbi:hypothetical protein D9758_014514 [Tetrapyrgos nigripes]|uniref:Nephrocystin 3-like N-terminal domain-containing protein n=1 Tax=Tetrapyrgos nigripes TaxID=182062 RepID=A0A8H5FSJ9_9AGAR|nr:hypothetical protein D9758_014514 [Tetrapyrgos nigripes]